MVAKSKADSKKTESVNQDQLNHLLAVRKSVGLNDAAIARAIRESKPGLKLSPQAVGKWFKTGKISGDKLRRFEALDPSKATRPAGKAEQIARAINQDEAIDPRAVARLRKDITVLRKAVVMLALASNEKTQGVVAEFAAYLKQAVPDAYYGERGFQVLLEAGLALADETEEADEVDSPALPIHRSAHKMPR